MCAKVPRRSFATKILTCFLRRAATKSAANCGVQHSECSSLRRAAFRVQLPAACRIQSAAPCGVQHSECSSLRRAAFRVQLPAACSIQSAAHCGVLPEESCSGRVPKGRHLPHPAPFVHPPARRGAPHAQAVGSHEPVPPTNWRLMSRQPGLHFTDHLAHTSRITRHTLHGSPGTHLTGSPGTHFTDHLAHTSRITWHTLHGSPGTGHPVRPRARPWR